MSNQLQEAIADKLEGIKKTLESGRTNKGIEELTVLIMALRPDDYEEENSPGVA